MKPANNEGPNSTIGSVSIEELSFRIGISEDQVRRIAHSNEEEISSSLLQAAEDSLRDLAYCEGIIELDEPEPPTEVVRVAARFSRHGSIESLEFYEDHPPAPIYLTDLDR